MTRYIVQSQDRFGQWTADAIGNIPVTFDTEGDALRACDELSRTLGIDVNALRVVAQPSRWQLVEEGNQYDFVEADNAADALEIARDNVDAALYDADRLPLRIHVAVRDEAGEEVASDYVILDAPEPKCTGSADDDQDDDDDHQWTDDKAYGAEAGMVALVSTCKRCGLRRSDGPVIDQSNGEYFRATQYFRSDE